MPASLMPAMMSSLSVYPEMMMRTVSGHSRRTSLRNSTPLTSGMRWSVSTTWMLCRSMMPRASAALDAVKTSKSSSRVRRRASWERTSSSMTRTVGSGVMRVPRTIRALTWKKSLLSSLYKREAPFGPRRGHSPLS